MIKFLSKSILALTTALPALLHGTPVFFGPTPYLSSADVPVGLYAGGPTFLENFEDGSLGGGITASVGSVIPPGFPGLIDSVDGDDGTIDGFGLAGHSWFSGSGGTGVKFTFASPVTAAGLVWTDGAGTVTFKAYGPGLVLLGSLTYSGADAFFSGTTAEDRFFGVKNVGGISAILVSNTHGGIEVDHVQYGAASSAVPDKGLGGLGILALLLLQWARRQGPIWAPSARK
jgi:hypothetical protein